MFNPALAVYLDKTRRGQPALVAEIAWKDNWVVSAFLFTTAGLKPRKGWAWVRAWVSSERFTR